jgi:hypothetical protein
MRTDRLRQLAEHLLHGKLIHEVFDFNFFNYTPNESLILKGCGTNGCAIGECPAVWPDDWSFNAFGMPTVRGNNKYTNSAASGEKWFELTHDEFRLLFMPFGGQPSWLEAYNLSVLRQLPWDATKEQVANNILTFCIVVESSAPYTIY